MHSHTPNHRHRAALAILAAVFLAAVPGSGVAQDTPAASYRILINGSVAGTATAVSNLPTTGSMPTMPPVPTTDTNPTLPPPAPMSSGPGTLVITTADPTLITAIQQWMKADNSGLTGSVEPRTVEIDRLDGAAPGARFRLTGARPSKIDAVAGASSITVSYQRLTTIS